MIEELVEKIKNCDLCKGMYIDKPCIKHNIYYKYMPTKPLILVVSESPPPGYKEDYLYNVNHSDNLREVLAEVFNIDESKVIDYLVSKHVFWTTAVKCRPLDKTYIEKMRDKCKEILHIEINVLKPEITVALGLKAKNSFKEIGIRPDFEERHPLYYGIYSKKHERLIGLSNLRRLFEKIFERIETLK